ncbi:hypothetical protein DW657_04205 [Prevotella sp. AM23-5]|nr:hypothetical protein DW657_04205 [Prevotella sp. AM23-5]
MLFILTHRFYSQFYSQLNFTHILLTKLLTLAYIMHVFVPILWVKMMVFDYVFIVKNDVSG